MNLTEVRQNLLEQLQARVADGIAEGMALRYCLAVGSERCVVDVAELASPVPWSWNLCISAGDAEESRGTRPLVGRPAGPHAWEVLEYVGAPEDAFRVVEILRDLIREEWQVGEGRLECAVQGETGWNGHREELERSLTLITGGGDLRFEGAERAPEGRVRLHVIEEHVFDEPVDEEGIEGPRSARRLRIQIDPHELFAFVLGFERECELEPLVGIFDVAEDQGFELGAEERPHWSARLRFWAHGMNLVELTSAEISGREGAEESALTGALRSVLARIESDGRARIAEAIDGEDDRNRILARWLDASRAIEDELCAVLLAMPELAALEAGDESAILRATEGEGEDAEADARSLREARKGRQKGRDAKAPESEHARAGEDARSGSRIDEPGLASFVPASALASDDARAVLAAGHAMDARGELPTRDDAAEGPAPTAFAVDAEPEQVFSSEDSPTAADLHLLPVSASAARQLEPTSFVGDEQDACEAKVLEIFDAEGTAVARLDAGDHGWVAASRTCFFSLGGGVLVDRGLAVWGEGRGRVLEVRCAQDVVLHALQLDHGFLRPGASIDLLLDRRRRREVERQTTAAAAAVGLLDRWSRETGESHSRRGNRGASERIEVLETKASTDGFSLGLRLPDVATRSWGAPERWRDRLEHELGEWILDAWWIDPAGATEEDRDALVIATADATVGRDGRRVGRRVLSLGPLGWIRTDAVTVPNSAHVGLVLLATPERLYDDVWTVRGIAGKRALALARTEVHLVEDAAGDLAIATRRGAPAAGSVSSSEALRKREPSTAGETAGLELEVVR
jgi:hypothetical protein